MPCFYNPNNALILPSTAVFSFPWTQSWHFLFALTQPTTWRLMSDASSQGTNINGIGRVLPKRPVLRIMGVNHPCEINGVNKTWAKMSFREFLTSMFQTSEKKHISYKKTSGTPLILRTYNLFSTVPIFAHISYICTNRVKLLKQWMSYSTPDHQ